MWTRKTSEERPAPRAMKRIDKADAEDRLENLPEMTGRSLVTFKPPLSSAQFDEFIGFVRLKLPADLDIRTIDSNLVDAIPNYWARYGVAVVPASTEDLKELPLAGFNVATIEPERYFRAKAIRMEGEDNDNEWAFKATGVTGSTRTGSGVRVAVLDTGISNHPAFGRRIVATTSCVKGYPPEDRSGHGTHIAGIAAGALPSGGNQRFGVAHGADILSARVMTDDRLCVNESIINGIEWAQDQNADIIVLAIGGTVTKEQMYDTAMEAVAQKALDAGSLVMAESGNDTNRSAADPVNDPANCPSILAVGSVGPDRSASATSIAPAVVSHFSCQQLAIDGEVNVVAPGERISSSWPPNGTQIQEGTSQAVAFAAGIAALWAEETGNRGVGLWRELERSASGFGASVMAAGHGLVQAP